MSRFPEMRSGLMRGGLERAMRHILTVLQNLSRKFGAFGIAQSGVAAVEFALVLPFLLLLYMGSTELSQAITADQRVTNVAGSMGDLVARTNTTLTRTELNDFFAASSKIMTPFGTTSLTQIVTCISVDAQGVAKVVWSEPYNGATKRVTNATYPLPAAMVAISKGSYVIVSEASYSYTPLVGAVFTANVPMYRVSFFIPRFAGLISVTG